MVGFVIASSQPTILTQSQSHDLMSLDGGDRSPLIETDEILPGDDTMSIINEKFASADDRMSRSMRSYS